MFFVLKLCRNLFARDKVIYIFTLKIDNLVHACITHPILIVLNKHNHTNKNCDNVLLLKYLSFSLWENKICLSKTMQLSYYKNRYYICHRKYFRGQFLKRNCEKEFDWKYENAGLLQLHFHRGFVHNPCLRSDKSCAKSPGAWKRYTVVLVHLWHTHTARNRDRNRYRNGIGINGF